MRGLPPPPSDVVRIEAWWDVNGVLVTTSWWIFAPGADAASAVDLNALLGSFFFFPLNDLLYVLSSDTSCTLLRCVTGPANGITAELVCAPNLGALDGSTALNAALVLTWVTADRVYGAHTHTWLPLSRQNMGTDKRRLSPLGFTESGARATDFLHSVNSMTSPDGASCTLVALHRQHLGVPLGASLMSPVQAARASPIIGTLQRRAASAPRAPSPL